MDPGDEVERRIARHLAAAAVSGRDGWVGAGTYVRRYLSGHARSGGVLDDLVRDVGFLGAADPQHLVPELGDLTKSEDPVVSSAARAYLRLGDDRIGVSFGQRQSNLSLVCSTNEPDARPALMRNLGATPWRVNFAAGAPVPFHPAPRHISKDLVAFALGDHADGLVMATSDGSNHIQTWNGETGELLERWRAHDDEVLTLLFLHEGDELKLVSASVDGTICTWDPRTGDLERRLTSPSPVLCAAADAAAETIAAGTQDGHIRIWEYATGHQLLDFHAHSDAVSAVEFGAGVHENLLVSGGLDRVVNVWDATNGKRLQSLSGPTGSVLDVAALGQPERLLVAAASSDESVWTWDADTGLELLEIRGHLGAATAITSVEIAGQAVLVSGSADMTIRTWDLATGSERNTLRGHVGAIRGLYTTNRDGRAVLVSGAADRSIRCWDAESGAGIVPNADSTPSSDIVIVWDEPSDGSASEQAAIGPIRCVRTGRDAGEFVVAAGVKDGAIQVRDSAQGNVRREWNAHEGGVLALAFDELGDDPVVISGGMDGRVRIWDARQGELRHDCVGHTDAVWGVATGRIGGLPIVVSASRDRTARAWDAGTGEEVMRFEGSHERLWGVACEEIDGDTVIAAGSTDRTVWLWDAENGQLRSRLLGHTRGVRFVAPTELRGRQALAAAGADGTIIVWDLRSGAVVSTLRGHGDGVWGLAAGVVAGRAVLASASDDLTVRVWDILTGRSLVLPQSAPAYSIDLLESTVAIGTDRHLISLSLDESLFDEMTG